MSYILVFLVFFNVNGRQVVVSHNEPYESKAECVAAEKYLENKPNTILASCMEVKE